MFKKTTILICLLILCFTFCSCNSNVPSEPVTNNEPSSVNTNDASYLTDGIINGTNAKNIETALKSIKEYNWWDDNELTQSDINNEWMVSCSNNEYNTYTKSYDLFATETLELTVASFATYDNDFDYILKCIDFFNTEYIDAEAVKAWVLEYDDSDGYATKIFGDAEFAVEMGADNDETKFEVSVYATE